MKNFDFDICSIPVFLLIIYTYFNRNLNRFRSYRLFFGFDVAFLFCAILDIAMELTVNPLPLSQTQVILGTLISFSYKLIRNSSAVLYLIFIFMITKTDYQLNSLKARLILWAPNLFLVILLIQNFFTGNVFRVDAVSGYSRGPWLIVFYIVAMFYELVGMIYCFYCRRYLDKDKWKALFSVYVLIGIAVIVEFIFPELMVELFATSIGMLLVVLIVMRPEESIALDVGAFTWQSFQNQIHNFVLSNAQIDIIVFHSVNAVENRNYLGDVRYAEVIQKLVKSIGDYLDGQKIRYDIYYERPENVYLVIEEPERVDSFQVTQGCLDTIGEIVKEVSNLNITNEVKALIIRCPQDLKDDERIISLCHRFPSMAPVNQQILLAKDIIESKDYEIHDHINEILNKAIRGDTLQMFYQPIYNVKSGKFTSAEALARIIDDQYGVISPLIFIKEAEANGKIIPLGKTIIESVFRFISEHDLDELGISYIEVNLSVAQCLQGDLPDMIAQLQSKYNVSPSRVNFEITESLFSSMGNEMGNNLNRLREMGYSLSLDDYGTGYSNIQRVLTYPMNLIKIDKCMVDDIQTKEGNVVIESTISMMHGISKGLVAEGVETRETLDILTNLGCEYIQGFYFSKPLPTDEFVAFIEEHNK